ncbi:MAG TPA: hypothetical protein VFW30_07740 [Bryocella sp.]|nr:hypothetical protein [Bryocella sp.]
MTDDLGIVASGISIMSSMRRWSLKVAARRTPLCASEVDFVKAAAALFRTAE